jgi:hypothetical protein
MFKFPFVKGGNSSVLLNTVGVPGRACQVNAVLSANTIRVFILCSSLRVTDEVCSSLNVLAALCRRSHGKARSE